MSKSDAEADAVILSSKIAEWQREKPTRFWDPGRRLLKSIRDYQKHGGRSGILSQIAAKWCVLRHRFWSVITGADIPLNCRIGGGLLIPHPNGVVIAPDAVLGPNCLVFQQVTIGTCGSRAGSPIIGGHVDIGAGARVLGPVRIGNHAKIGANAVVLSDVPAGATAVGVPAKVLSSTSG